jgi:hypothetical protein
MYEWILITALIILMFVINYFMVQVQQPLAFYIRTLFSLCFFAIIWFGGENNNPAIRLITFIFVISNMVKNYLDFRKYKKLLKTPKKITE